MKTQDKTYTIELAPGIKAKYCLKRLGQQPPHEGDGVVVEATILLPARSKFLLPEIQFDTRLKIAGAPLHGGWGFTDSNDYRGCARTFVATKWSQAFTEAEQWARGELQKLADALAARAVALLEAED